MNVKKVDKNARRLQTTPLVRFSVIDYKYKIPIMDMAPAYQREGSVWTLQQKRRLIDTVVNGLDMPKLYFEVLRDGRVDEKTGRTLSYAVLDGKQRLEAIRDFLNDDISLPDDFIFFARPSVAAAGKRLSDLAANPEMRPLYEAFFDYKLPVVEVIADSGDLVEEMFQRLNSATSLNAAEKRNAISGQVRDTSNDLAESDFFTSRVAIRNARYKYRELSSKFLLIERQLTEDGAIRDTKAKTLMNFFLDSKKKLIGDGEVEVLGRAVRANLEKMERVFIPNDPLLRSIGTVIVYYIAFRDPDFAQNVNREILEEFEELRRSESLESDRSDASAEVIRRYNAFVQSTNDGVPLEFRTDVLKAFVQGKREQSVDMRLSGLLTRDVFESEESE